MIYLDNAATTQYKPPEVIAAVNEALTTLPYNPNRSGSKACIQLQQRIANVRRKVAGLVNCDEGRVVFTSGCTAALNLALVGTVRRGHIIATATEHNSVLRTLDAIASKGICDVDYVRPDENGDILTEQIARLVRPDTYLVCVCGTSNVTGHTQRLTDIGAFCRSRNLLFAVDCAQSVGYTDIDMRRDNIDLVAFGAHKGLHAMQGAGVLCCSSRVTPRPTVFGGTGTDSHLTKQPTDIPDGLEAGTLPCPAILAMGAGIDWYLANRQANALRMRETQQLLLDNLSQIPSVKLYSAPNECGIVSFNISALDSNAVADVLDSKFDIAVRGGLQCAPLMHRYLGTFETGIVRASVSCQTTKQDCYQLLYAVDYLARKGV